jgi:hypothetical protein
MSQDVYRVLKNHLQFSSISQGTNDLMTLAKMKDLLEIESILVGSLVYSDEKGHYQNVWNNNVALIHRSESPSLHVPAFGHTFRHRDYPYSREYWNDNERDELVIKYADLMRIQIINRDAGFLIIDAV